MVGLKLLHWIGIAILAVPVAYGVSKVLGLGVACPQGATVICPLFGRGVLLVLYLACAAVLFGITYAVLRER